MDASPAMSAMGRKRTFGWHVRFGWKADIREWSFDRLVVAVSGLSALGLPKRNCRRSVVACPPKLFGLPERTQAKLEIARFSHGRLKKIVLALHRHLDLGRRLIVPRMAHESVRRGPFAALLVLLSLLLGVAPATGAVPSLRDPLSRLGSAHPGAPPTAIRPADRYVVSAVAPDADPTSFGPPPEPRVVVERLPGRPLPQVALLASQEVAQFAGAHYQARAPPAV